MSALQKDIDILSHLPIKDFPGTLGGTLLGVLNTAAFFQIIRFSKNFLRSKCGLSAKKRPANETYLDKLEFQYSYWFTRQAE